MMGLGGLGLDKQLGAIMNANRSNPAALQGKITQQQNPATIAQQQDQALRQGAMADL